MTIAGDALPVRLRLAETTDLPEMIATARRAPTASHWSADQYEKLVENGVVLIAEISGVFCGFITAQTVTDEWEIENVVVAPEFQRKGIAGALVQAVLTRARHGKAVRVLLEVRESNLAARSLYEKLGFSAEADRASYYRNPDESATLYSIRL